MAKRRIDGLRDDVVAAAQEWLAVCRDPNIGPVIPQHDDMLRLWDAEESLASALDALNAFMFPIVDSPGEYVEGSPETSRNAALAAAPMLGSVRRQIVEEILSVQHYGNHGLTDEELEVRLKIKHQTLSSARNHLVNIGWVVDSGYRRVSGAKQPVVVWTLTEAATIKMKEIA